MLQSVRELMLPAAQARLLLLVNHVVSREPAAVDRLRSHAGRRVAVELIGQPTWLPTLPPMRVQVTPAGLFDIEEEPPTVDADLRLRVAMPKPEHLLAVLAGGARPEVHVEGAAAMAADMHWLADNLRWDIEGDLAEVFGLTASRMVMSVGRAAAQTLRRTFNSGATTAPDGTPR
jgi:ubiquinone biosynthesis protein UbiJ